jgi:hypothetical protein
VEALEGGRADGPLDDVVALHGELGIVEAVARLEAERTRVGIADELLLRVLAALPIPSLASLSGTAGTSMTGRVGTARRLPAVVRSSIGSASPKLPQYGWPSASELIVLVDCLDSFDLHARLPMEVSKLPNSDTP